MECATEEEEKKDFDCWRIKAPALLVGRTHTRLPTTRMLKTFGKTKFH